MGALALTRAPAAALALAAPALTAAPSRPSAVELDGGSCEVSASVSLLQHSGRGAGASTGARRALEPKARAAATPATRAATARSTEARQGSGEEASSNCSTVPIWPSSCAASDAPMLPHGACQWPPLPPAPGRRGLTAVDDAGSFYWSGYNGGDEAVQGFSYFTKVFSLFGEDYPLFGMQIGMGFTWLSPTPQHPGAATCFCNPALLPAGNVNCCTAAYNYCRYLWNNVEGGAGYLMYQFPTTQPKFRPNSAAACYDEMASTPLWPFAKTTMLACGSMGVVLLSNQLLVVPDGEAFEADGNLGVAFVRTPYGKTRFDDGRNFWTLVLDASNFAGPVVYWLPEFYAARNDGASNSNPTDLGTADSLTLQFASAYEWARLATLKQEQSDGTKFYKLPKITFPYHGGRSILMAGQSSYTNAQTLDVLESALDGNGFGPGSSVLQRGRSIRCGSVNKRATMALSASADQYDAGTLSQGLESDTCVFSFQGTNCDANNQTCELPEYVRTVVGDATQATEAASAPTDLRWSAFETQAAPGTAPGAAYDALSTNAPCVHSPGPASPTLYCKQLGEAPSGTYVAWRWYKFADQPSLQRAKLTEVQRFFMQARVEAFHRSMQVARGWIPSAGPIEGEPRAAFDTRLFVAPPAGFEYGYVPVVLYQGLQWPSGCHDEEPDDKTTTRKPDDQKYWPCAIL